MKLSKFLRSVEQIPPTDYLEWWYIRRGLHEQAIQWWNTLPRPERIRRQDDEMGWSRRQDYFDPVTEIRHRPVVLIGWEQTPRIEPTAPFEMVMFSPHLNDGNMAVGLLTINDDGHMIVAEDLSTPAVWSTLIHWSTAYRQFALEPLPRRPTVDIDVAERLAEGEGKKKEIARVFIVKWRKPATRGPVADPAGLNVAWSHRWWSRAHLRRLKDGRIIPVRGSVKGPADKPFILKTPINSLVR